MTTPPEFDQERLHRLLGRDETGWLVSRVRARMERGQPLHGQVSIPDPTPDQRRAVEALLGRPPGQGRTLTVSLQDVDAVLRRGGVHTGGLAGAMVSLGGPVTLQPEERATRAAAWRRAMEPLAALAAERPVLAPWYDDVAARGLVRRLCATPDAAAPAVEAAARLLAMLPVAGTPLGQLAVTVTGDAHGLDSGRPLSTIALSAIRNIWWVGDFLEAGPARRRRALWDCVGVITDELSSTVLVLNLNASVDSGLGRLIGAARDDGEPVVLTLRQLSRRAVRFEPAPVFVCENPSVVLAAAEVLGSRCPAIVCVAGQPTTAALRLLDGLASAGAPLVYHGDFDWGGLRIANLLWAQLPMRPWRYDTTAYESTAGARGRALTGSPVAAAWDAHLEPAMRSRGVRVEEEAVLADLLSDLSQSAAGGALA